jgi:signal transduction histidine kinase
LLALGIVAAVLVYSYAMSRQLDVDAEQDAWLINVSGQQRMLSQRIAMLSRDVFARRTGRIPLALEYSDQHSRELLSQSIEKMRSNRNDIHRNWLAGGLNGAWLNDPYLRELDARVLEYLRIASAVESAPSDPSAAGWIAFLGSEAKGDLLPQLDSVVQQYQSLADERLHRGMTRERVQLAIGLAVLLAEIFLIFRPMVVSTICALNQMRIKNGQLRDVGFRLSHDLRAPVASSMGLADLANESLAGGEHEEAQFAIRELTKSLSGLDKHISDMNLVIDQPHVQLLGEPLDIRELVDESMERLEHMESYDRLQIEVNIPVGTVWNGQRGMLLSIFENLISNAVKYKDSACDSSWLRIDSVVTTDAITLEFSDNGLGVPRDRQKRLFERYERSHEGHAPGSGLGLYLARQSAERLGGTLDFTATRDGSRFSLMLPILVASKTDVTV